MAEKNAASDPKELTDEQKIKQLKKDNEALELKLRSLDKAPAAKESDEVMTVIENLSKKIEELERRPQQVQTIDGKKPKYQTKDPKDLLPDGEGVTFTARYVLKVIPGYMDATGLEVVAPYGIISMKYAASDQRMDGKEEEIINFCSYTTRWKKEIEFLRGHPEFGVTFNDNMNKVAASNPKEHQFRSQAGHAVSGMSPESVLSYADQYKINADKKSIKDLKPLIMEAMVKDFMAQEKALNDEISDRILKQAAKHL